MEINLEHLDDRHVHCVDLIYFLFSIIFETRHVHDFDLVMLQYSGVGLRISCI